jgi:hypothetical protein
MINKDGKLICPHCHCVLKQENFVLTSYPVQFQYYCPKCNYYTTSYTSGLGEINSCGKTIERYQDICIDVGVNGLIIKQRGNKMTEFKLTICDDKETIILECEGVRRVINQGLFRLSLDHARHIIETKVSGL